MASTNPASGQTPWERWLQSEGAEEALRAFRARFGQDALDLCARVARRMAGDPELAARVAHRHTLLGRHYLELGATRMPATAHAAGKRALLVTLLLESGERFFAA